MRDIKFRAWNKINNKMLQWGNLNNQYNTLNCLGYEHLEVMQYTGLKDKDDNEIYEGDIANIINNSVDEEDGYFIVKYDIETARYILSGNGLVYDFDNTYANECKIIGNIYENPELLKEV